MDWLKNIKIQNKLSPMLSIYAYRDNLLKDAYLSEAEKQERLDTMEYIVVLFNGTYRQYIDDIDGASLRKDRESCVNKKCYDVT